MVVGERPAEEYVPGRPFYVGFGVLLTALLLPGLYAASRPERGEGAGFESWVWPVGLVALAIFVPGFVQYLVLRSPGAAPERVRCSERGNPRFFVSWWRVPGCSLAGGQFAVAYCVPSVIVCAIALVYVFRFPGAAPFLAFVLPFHLGNF